MRILITNDDAYNAIGLKELVKVASNYGECVVIAPKFEQSGKSHSLNIRVDMEFKKVEDIIPGVDTFYLDSTPADCVRVASYIYKNNFDLVLSGVNNGFNLGEDIIYSGTMAAATEACLLGMKAIAFSTSRDDVDKISENLEKIMKYIFDNKLLDIWNLYNVNIPVNYIGIKYTGQGYTHYDLDFASNGDFIRSVGRPIICADNIEYSDVDAVYNNNVSISPITYIRTNKDVLKKLV